MQPGPRHQRRQPLHELQRRHHDVGRAVVPGGLQAQHDLAGAVQLQPFVGDSRARDVSAQLLEPLAIVGAAAGFANGEVQARYDARNPQALKRLIAAGTQLRPFSPSIMEACWKASIEVNNETSAVNADYKKVWDSIEAFRNDEYLWWQVAEYGYDTFMIRTTRRT